MKIGLLLYSGCIPSGLFAFSDMLLAANTRTGTKQFEFCWLSEQGAPVSCANGVELPSVRLGGAKIDGLLIPGAWRDSSNIHTEEDSALVQSIARLDRSIPVMSYCTGVYLAARAGRLDGQVATTTWWLLQSIRERFPKVRWQINSTFMDSRRNSTAAGVNGYLPMALSLIERHCGKHIATDIQQYMVLPRPLERNTPFRELPQLMQQNTFLRDVFYWVEQASYTEMTATALAEHLKTTPRTLSRKIATMTGHSCSRLLRLIKLNQVSDLLISTGKSIYAISDELGFADDTSLRRSFKQITGMTPGEYRRRFG
ncbi:transcriptional regulator, AraC family with amidase-like domain [Microbulbifer donghaiensis]|uniref:Transcriptional regulator, AraC family with amidase-like domain n=2 Tax=Microbulbifer donghaiensis TaxID=494016 RepID=A0A1M4VDU0_9GAMM|nr:transcriptional regulator, AraC family with amidase-like domain [Microbulbifer donghaiensis]